MGQTDLAVRLLAERHLAALLPSLLVGRSIEVIAVERSELKLIERVSDHVVRARVDGEEAVLHIEFQVRHEEDLPGRVLAYHALLSYRHRPTPVLSVVVYLMASAPPVPLPSGVHQARLDFEYEIFCPWERNIGLAEVRRRPALAPLAALTPAIQDADLPEVRRAIEEAPGLAASERADLLALTYFIAGRRFAGDLLESLIGSSAMEESSTYQYVIEKGRAEGLRSAIRDLAAARLGRAPERLEERLSSLGADALHTLFTDLLHADEGRFRSLLSG